MKTRERQNVMVDLRRVLAIGALAALLPATACAHARPRADLTVPRGSLATANGALTGSFVVKNSGHRRAGRTAAALVVGGHVVGGFSVPALRPRSSRTVKVAVKQPGGLPSGTTAVHACADAALAVRERSEANNCRTVASLTIAAPAPAPAPSPAPAPAPP